MPSPSLLSDPAGLDELTDWGQVPEPVGEPVSVQSGRLLFRNSDGSSEMGVWQCTPGRWRCEIERDEFCYFLDGSAVYTAGTGETFTVGPGVAAAFPRGWQGECEVRETVRKVYMIR